MSQPHPSLLSLSIAAANAVPIPASPITEPATRSSQGVAMNTTKHRRLSSAGRSRRRLSDARDAATRPFPTPLQTASASLAALSLSSPTVSHRPVHDARPIQVPRAASVQVMSEPDAVSIDDTNLSASSHQSHTLASNSVNNTKSGRKRGTVFTCESCSKVYRHPSCLMKHRWEHTPQWREAAKFVLSKHQQVQLLEAAAILSHLSLGSASLPEDRSLWPSFLSGGLVPPPASVSINDDGQTSTTAAVTSPPTSGSSAHTSFPISSSVPAATVLGSHLEATGPQLHDYAVSSPGIGVTQVRPGMLGMPTAPISPSSPMPVPVQQMSSSREDDALNLLALRSASVTSGSPASSPAPLSSLRSHPRVHGHSHSLSYSHSRSLSASQASKEMKRRLSNAYEYGLMCGAGLGISAGYPYTPNLTGGWSLPRSSIRSKSGSSGSRSQSQSASESRSDDEDEDEVEFGDVDLGDEIDVGRVRQGSIYARMHAWKAEDRDSGSTDINAREGEQDVEDEKGVKKGPEQTWDGMEMEMEMEMD